MGEGTFEGTVKPPVGEDERSWAEGMKLVGRKRGKKKLIPWRPESILEERSISNQEGGENVPATAIIGFTLENVVIPGITSILNMVVTGYMLFVAITVLTAILCHKSR